MEKLTNMKENTEAANYNLALQEQSKVFEEARAMGLQNDITEATKQTQIDAVIQNYYLNSLTAFEKIAGIELKGKEAAYISKQIEWYSFEATTKRMSAEAMQSMAKSAAERVKNDFEIAGKKTRPRAGENPTKLDIRKHKITMHSSRNSRRHCVNVQKANSESRRKNI